MHSITMYVNHRPCPGQESQASESRASNPGLGCGTLSWMAAQTPAPRALAAADDDMT